MFLKKSLTLLLLSLFLTACSVAADDEAPDDDIIDDGPITSFKDSKRNGTKNNSLKIATAVQITKNWQNGIITTDDITDAMVEFDYNDEGNFADGGSLRLYIDGQQHITGSTASGDKDSINYVVTDNLSDDTFDALGFSRGSQYFGFTADYMALVYWRLDRDLLDDTHGYAIAGFETGFAAIPSTETNISFKGKGRGKYHYLNEVNGESVDSTYFDVTAIVDFSNKNINLSSTNTCTVSIALIEFCNSSYAAYWKPHLDFTAPSLSYVDGETAITGTIETAGDVGNNIAKLTGTADARFYGTGADVATELGGTFNMVNTDAAYVGWFGAKRGYEPIIPEEPMMPNLTIDKTIIGGIINTNAPAINANNLESFVDEARYGTNGNGFTVASAVLIGKNTTTNIISANNIDNAIAAFDYQADGVFDKVQLYFTDKIYSTTTANNNTTNNKVDFLISHYIDVSAGDEPHQVGVSKSDYAFGFDAEYMVRIYWELTQDAYGAYGYGIAGFETDGAHIPTTTGIVNFTGEGNGRYYDSDSGRNTSSWPSIITADVDFVNRNVFVTGKVSSSAHSLDFTGNLGYDLNTNILTGTDWATTGVGGNGYPQLTGTAQARFYGTGTTDAAIEFGGTFNLTNATSAYAGWFGATSVQPPPPPPAKLLTIGNVPGQSSVTTENYDSIPSALAASKNFGDRIVFVLDGVGVRAETASDDTTEIASYLAALKLTIYKEPGTIEAATVYIDIDNNTADSTEHTISNTSNNSATKLEKMIEGKTANEILTVDRSFSDSFTADYMINASWTYMTDSNETQQGYMVAGMETQPYNIPNDIGVITFNGFGRGLHKENGNDTLTKFGVTAIVDFATLTTDLTVKNTKDSDDDSALTDLNFTSTLTYDSSDSNIRGFVTDVDGMNGTAYAYFYGTKGVKNGPNNSRVNFDNVAKELGGAFSMNSNTAEYIGYFGTKQYEFVPPTPPVALTITPPALDNDGYDSITATAAAALQGFQSKSLVLQGLGVRAENANVDTPLTTTTAIASYESVLFIKFDSLVIVEADLYIDESKHSIENLNNDTSTTLVEGINGESSNPLNVNRSFSDDFTADYMVAALWTYEPTGTNSSNQGFMVAGMETAGTDIPTNTGTATFTGAGRGLHKEFTDIYTKFGITADVDFSAYSVGLTIKDTRNSNNNNDNTNALPNLNFTANLMYSAQQNNISGHVENVDGMNGTAHARFYGTGSTNAAKELGGTFSMKDGTAEYIGYFGAKQ